MGRGSGDQSSRPCTNANGIVSAHDIHSDELIPPAICTLMSQDRLVLLEINRCKREGRWFNVIGRLKNFFL